MSFLTEQQKRQYLAGYQSAIVELRTKREEALKEGDVVQAQRLTDKIDEVKEQVQKTKQVVSQQQVNTQPTPDFVEWKGQNSWYTVDRTLTTVADGVGAAYLQDNPGCTEKQMLNAVSREIKKRFPEKFNIIKSPPSPDGEGGIKGSSRGSSASSLEQGMTEEQRSIMKTILKSTGMTKEQYFKQYNS